MSHITAQETRERIIAIASGHVEKIKSHMASIPKENRHEKKAYAIAVNMAGHCVSFPQYSFQRTGAELTAFLFRRIFEECRGTSHELFAGYREAAEALSPEEKEAFAVYAHTLYMLHNAFYHRHLTHLQTASEAAVPEHPEEILEDRVILSVIGEILTEWKAWWNSAGSLPCDVGYWEDYMASLPKEVS